MTFARLNEIVNGKRGVSVDTVLRFSQAFGTTTDLWLNIQRMTDLYEAMHSPKAKEIARITPVSESNVDRVSVRAAKRLGSKRAAESVP